MALAEDITQDVFVKMLEHLTTLSELEALEPWLYRVASNACFSRLKRDTSVWEKVRRALMLSPSIHSHTPERQVQVQESLQQTLASLNQLPAKERVVFCMHTLDELSQQQIATTLSLSKGYVSKLLHRAKQRLFEQGWED